MRKHMTALHWILAAVALALLAAFAYLYAVTWIESCQARRLEGKQPYASAAANAPRTAVVYFSRSGNTALAARHVAQRLDAQLFPLQAPSYELGMAAIDAAAGKRRPAVVRIRHGGGEGHAVATCCRPGHAGHVVRRAHDDLTADVAEAHPRPGQAGVGRVDLGLDLQTDTAGQRCDAGGEAHQTSAPSNTATKSVSVLPTSLAATAPMLLRACACSGAVNDCAASKRTRLLTAVSSASRPLVPFCSSCWISSRVRAFVIVHRPSPSIDSGAQLAQFDQVALTCGRFMPNAS